MKKIISRIAIALSYVATLLTFATPVAALDNGKIAFQSNHEGNNEIYTIKPDGSSLANITNNAAADTNPAWSPDGTKIAFASDRDGNTELYVMDSDGSNVTRLTNNTQGADTMPAWSPDGTKIAYISSNASELYTIRTMNSDGTSDSQVTFSDNGGERQDPSWSADGLKLAYKIQTGTDHAIYEIILSGVNATRITQASPDASDYFPAYSPDGTKIAYTTFGTGDLDMFVMNANGTGASAITTGGGDDNDPAWSPDGTMLAYRNGGQLNIVSASGGTGTAVTTGLSVSKPSWTIARPSTTTGTDSKVTGTVAEGESLPNTTLNAGGTSGIDTLVINGSTQGVQVGSGGILKGTGNAGIVDVLSGGTLAPGLSPGCIATGNLTFSSGSTYAVEIEGNTTCTQYDQTQVTGTVDLGDATLDIQRLATFTPAINDTFTIVTNDGADAVTGTFLNLAEGETVVVDGVTYQISYVGGDGNDVVLTVIDISGVPVDEATTPTAPDTGFALITNNPAIILAITTISALALLALVRKAQPQK